MSALEESDRRVAARDRRRELRAHTRQVALRFEGVEIDHAWTPHRHDTSSRVGAASAIPAGAPTTTIKARSIAIVGGSAGVSPGSPRIALELRRRARLGHPPQGAHAPRGRFHAGLVLGDEEHREIAPAARSETGSRDRREPRPRLAQERRAIDSRNVAQRLLDPPCGDERALGVVAGGDAPGARQPDPVAPAAEPEMPEEREPAGFPEEQSRAVGD